MAIACKIKEYLLLYRFFNDNLQVIDNFNQNYTNAFECGLLM